MEDQKLCPAGALLAQRMGIGVKSLQIGAADVRAACNEVVRSLQDIRNTTTALHTRLGDVERRADKNDTETISLGKKMEGHVGVHVGFEQAGIVTGRRYAVVGVCSAVIISLVACFSLFQVFLS